MVLHLLGVVAMEVMVLQPKVAFTVLVVALAVKMEHLAQAALEQFALFGPEQQGNFHQQTQVIYRKK